MNSSISALVVSILGFWFHWDSLLFVVDFVDFADFVFLPGKLSPLTVELSVSLSRFLLSGNAWRISADVPKAPLSKFGYSKEK